MSEPRAPEPTQDTKRWRLTLEDGAYSRFEDITVSGRELRMNNTPERYKDLLAARFDLAVRKLREEFLADA